MKKYFCTFVLLVSVCTTALAQTSNGSNDEVKISAPTRLIELPPEKRNPIVVPKSSIPITIDGRIDEESWKSAAVLKDFVQTSPGDNIAPSRPTEVYLTYDEKHLYIGFKCWDEKDKIRATIAKRDDVFGEDNVRVWLDTYNDQRRAYVLGFNPHGIQQDGIFTENQGADFTVDIVMESKGIIEDWGWSVEAKIPFKSLRYSAGKGKLWGFNAARNIDRFNDEFDQWLPDDRNISGFLVKHGKITGLDEIKYERTLEVVPTVKFSETGSLVHANEAQAGRFVNRPLTTDLGVTLKYTLSPNITLDAAVNPDFAEVEADALVVSANQRFPIFFAEKRPFFLEGKEIFETPLQPFYSRTIVDPDFAGKLSGKIDKTSFGFLVASDKAPGNFSEDDRTRLRECNAAVNGICRLGEFIDKNALFGVVRVKRDFGKNNNIGFFSTARVFPRDRNFVGGIDGTIKLNPKTVLAFQTLATHTRRNFYDPKLDESQYRTGNGAGYYFSVDYTTDRHGWYFEAIGRSRDYRASTGFTPRTNSNQVFFANRVSTKSNPKATFVRTNWNQFTRYTYDWDGRPQGFLAGTGVNASMQGNLWIGFETGYQFEKIYEDDGFGSDRRGTRRNGSRPSGGFFGLPTRFAHQPYASANFNKRVNKQLFLYGFAGTVIGAFDFDFGAGNRFPRRSPAFLAYSSTPAYGQYLAELAAYQANPDTYGPRPEPPPGEPSLDPGKGIQFDMEFGGDYKPVDSLNIGLRYTKSRLTRSDNDEVAFDTNIFSLRTTYQFTRFTFARLRLDYDSLSSRAASQILFGWSPNPGTAFYVGYDDRFSYNGFNPFTDASINGFARNERTFFIRASYLFRKSF